MCADASYKPIWLEYLDKFDKARQFYFFGIRVTSSETHVNLGTIICKAPFLEKIDLPSMMYLLRFKKRNKAGHYGEKIDQNIKLKGNF